MTSSRPLHGVPSLVSICLSILSRYPDQLHSILPHYRLRHRAELNDIDALSLDPKAWATLIQVYDSLPGCLSTFSLPLHDPDMPLLQSIPSTPRFTLITVVEFPACRGLSDENLVHLKSLHTLTALDVSENASITSHGLIAFVSTLQLDTGPWPLRILRLRNCIEITSGVYPHLSKFPLLSVVDLRGTKCSRSIPPPHGFATKGHPLLFHPRKLSESLSHLHDLSPSIYSSSNIFTLLVNELRPRKSAAEGLICHDNTVVTISPTDYRLYLDNANAITRRVEAREERLRHEENSAAWHMRQELLELTKDEYEEMYPLSAIRREVLASSKYNALAGPSRLASQNSLPPAPRVSSSTLPSGFQPISRSRSTTSRSRTDSNDSAARQAKSNASHLRVRDPPASRTPSTLPSGFQPLPSATRRPSSTSASRLPPAPIRSTSNPYSPSLPGGFQSTALTTRLSSHSDNQRTKASASRLGVQGPPKPDASATPPRLWVNPEEEPFMLYRSPPPWSALEEAQSALRVREAERREVVKRNVQVRASDVAKVDLGGKKAAAVRQQMGSLLVKRTEIRQMFGLSVPTSMSAPALSTFTPMPNRNPFKKRVMTTIAIDKPGSNAPPASATSIKDIEQGLIPLSKVPTPLFTQDLLDASAKENKKAGLSSEGSSSTSQAAKKQKRSSLPSASGSGPKPKSKQPRASEGGSSGTLDLRKWLATK